MSANNVVYQDDSSIDDEAELLRRIPPWHVIWDDNKQCYRPSSAAFENHPNGSPMSVILAEDLLISGRSLESALASHKDFALAAITASLVRELGQGVAREPLPDEPAHAVVFGDKPKRVSRRMAKSMRWVVQPNDRVWRRE